MAVINVLDSGIFNRIAAGEVVERPASIVKELVENSIDAGAKHIEIEIESGGKSRITVRDDGCGIDKENIAKAFLPHATSKVFSVADLDRICTLGFRGEALASIAAVAKVTMQSRVEGSGLGNELVFEDGVCVSNNPIGSPLGTCVTVEELFRNIPARAKFLKTARSEENEISDLISRLILANPDTVFKYSADGKIIYHTSGEGLGAALFHIYGGDCADNCFHINAKDGNNVRLSGFFGKPGFSKPNRTYQTLIVNGRYVYNQAIAFAVYNVFEQHLMKRQYPLFVLRIDIPYEDVDVNVHPNKTEVRFLRQNEIVSFLRSVLFREINKQKEIPEAAIASAFTVSRSFSEEEAVVTDTKESLGETGKAFAEPRQASRFFFNAGHGGLAERSEISQKIADKIFSGSVPLSEGAAVCEEIIIPQSSPVYIGRAFNSYIIYELNETLFIIDQHAAHERLLYDKLTENLVSGKTVVQPMHFPYIFDLNNSEKLIMDERLDAYRQIGIDIEEFGGNSYKISAMPQVLTGIRLGDFLNESLKISAPRDADALTFLKDKLASEACHAAVKAGDDLESADAEYLIRTVLETDTLRCPHGRPVIIKIPKKELEKWFKRIL